MIKYLLVFIVLLSLTGCATFNKLFIDKKHLKCYYGGKVIFDGYANEKVRLFVKNELAGGFIEVNVKCEIITEEKNEQEH